MIAHPTSLGCHQLYVVIVAKPYAWLQEPCFCSVVVFVNIVRFPPERYCQISSAIAETSLYSRFGGGIGKRGGVCQGSVRQASSELLQFWFPWPTGAIPQ